MGFTSGNGKHASELVAVMEEAGQTVPPKLMEMGGSRFGGGRKRGRYDDNKFGGGSRRPSSGSSYQSGPSPAKRPAPSGGGGYNQAGSSSGQGNWGNNNNNNNNNNTNKNWDNPK